MKLRTKFKIKKDDKVIIIAGKDKGKTGTVLQMLPAENKVLVQGVNVVKKHQKPNQNSAGAIIEKELPIHISNVAYFDEDSAKASKLGYKIDDEKKVRYLKSSGKII